MEYSDGTYLCDNYDPASGWLSSVAILAASCGWQGQLRTTILASGLSYSGDVGAAGLVTAADVNTGNGTTYSYAASYDDDLRLLSSGLSVAGGGALLYQVQPSYDAASNVMRVDTTLPASATDNQSFCYDEQNRLTWASSFSDTGPCGIVNNGGSLTAQSAKYTATYSYDALDRLTSGPANGGSSYTYGDAAHLHAATGTSGGYSATYDAAGNMTCRAPTSSTTCTGSSPTGAGPTYDNEGQLVGWTSALNGQPTPNTAGFAYDGEGARVALKTTTGTGVVTTTDYLLGGLEEQQTVGGSVHPSSTLTEYYPLPGIGTAVRVNTSSASTLSYLAGDQLGSVSVALSTSGTVTAQALYSPYGTVRYSSGTMPTAHGYTGQLADAMTGLDDYGARYYDPALGAFTSADTTNAGGLNRYAYVGGNPESATDPSGHKPTDADGLWPILVASADPLFLAAELLIVSSYLLYYTLTTPYPTNTPSQYHGAVPAAAPTAQPVWGPPAASPGSNQWTAPDQNAIRGAENAHPAPKPHNGPTNKPGPGTPGTGPTGPGGEPLGSSPNGEQGPEPEPSTSGARSCDPKMARLV